jgi:phosphate:Na+ symporter
MYVLAELLDTKSIIFLITGGLGIFLFGITYMGDALKLLAGDKLRDIIEKYTTNPIYGALVGVVVTGLIQSSSGTTALTIGLVRAGLMNLNQAIGIIIGANIGTTVTAFLIGLKLTKVALPIMAVGAFFYMFSHHKKLKHFGQALFGFGSLFYGLSLMSQALKPMKDLPFFNDFMISLSDNPVMGVIVGTGLTVLVQSSSATVGILQGIFAEGALDLRAALPILFGTNIGTTITAVLAAIGGSLTARRAASAHVFFNVLGSVLFLIILVPFTGLIASISTNLNLNAESQIAVAHGIFNVTMTLLLLPFVSQLANLVRFVVPGKEDTLHDFDEELLNPGLIIASQSMALSQANKAVVHSAKLIIKQLKELNAFVKSNEEKYLQNVYQLEDIIDSLEIKIRDYLVSLSGEELTEVELQELQMLLKTIKDIERMGDHITNLAEIFEDIREQKDSLSEDASHDFKRMFAATLEIVNLTVQALETKDPVISGRIFEREDAIDKLEKKYRERHIYRVRQGNCNGYISAVFVDILNNMERVADHAQNIGEYVIGEEKEVEIDYAYLDQLLEEIDNA